MPPGDSLETYVGVVYEGVDAFKIVSLPWCILPLMHKVSRTLYSQHRCGVVFYWCIPSLMHKVSRTLYSHVRPSPDAPGLSHFVQPASLRSCFLLHTIMQAAIKDVKRKFALKKICPKNTTYNNLLSTRE